MTLTVFWRRRRNSILKSENCHTDACLPVDAETPNAYGDRLRSQCKANAKPMRSQCKANAKPMQSQWSNIAACPPPAECEAHVEAHAIMGRGSHDIAYRHLVIHNWIGIWQFAFSIEFLRLEKNRLLCMSWATFSMRSVDGGSLSNDSCSARFVCNGHNRPHGTIWNDRGSTCKRPCEGRTLE